RRRAVACEGLLRRLAHVQSERGRADLFARNLRASGGAFVSLYFLKSIKPDRGLGGSTMSPSGAELLRDIKSRIEEIDPSQVNELIDEGVAIIDVRETEEFAAGHLPGAKHVPKSYLETRIENAVPDRDAQIVLYCQSGNRSAWAARTLEEDLGYANVSSM